MELSAPDSAGPSTRRCVWATWWYPATHASKPAPRSFGERFIASIMWPSPRPRKRTLPAQTGAIAVDMESAAVERKAAEWNVPYLCIRAVSDRAGDTLPLDFNRYRNARGDFSRSRIALAAITRPFTVMPQLMEFDRNCRRAVDALGDFLADCRF